MLISLAVLDDLTPRSLVGHDDADDGPSQTLGALRGLALAVAVAVAASQDGAERSRA